MVPNPSAKRQHLRGYRVAPDGAEMISEGAAHRLRKYLLEPDDILLARSGTMIAPAIVVAEQGTMLLGNNLVRLRVRNREEIDPLFLLAWLTSTHVMADIAASATGSAVPTFRKAVLGSQLITVPPIAEQRGMGETMRAIDDQVAALQALAAASARARAALVDGLVTGVVGVSVLPLSSPPH